MKMKNTANKGAEWYAERIACLAEFTTSERYEVLRRTGELFAMLKYLSLIHI